MDFLIWKKRFTVETMQYIMQYVLEYSNQTFLKRMYTTSSSNDVICQLDSHLARPAGQHMRDNVQTQVPRGS